MSARRAVGGSRYLYDSFEAAQARIDAQERVFEARKEALEFRIMRLEQAVERLERRLWLAVYGVAAGVLLHGALALVQLTT
ncbi:MAG: gene transfer agent protein [Roseibaca calidilacus]|uniref:Gene transfer agent protein n=1 Tax=Roseibaca calidilacus TaxID=1666912 RepID=A0A0N8K8Z2_9RHOB|nr:hypothetical protein [Roseibaca calidilacus]KPP95889.1 MAG: gene transfer agent protein [Roseibaca calidilacus]CUX81543.1 hypothetical protein Ga0058931_1826 [Roseibaca calidilacus]